MVKEISNSQSWMTGISAYKVNVRLSIKLIKFNFGEYNNSSLMAENINEKFMVQV